MDILCFQTVAGTHRKVQLGQAHVQFHFQFRVSAAAVAAVRAGKDARAEFRVLNERVEVLAQDLGRFDHRHFRMNRAVGPNLQRQLVVVRFLSDACLVDRVADTNHRAEHGVDRDDADLLHVGAVLGRGYITASVLDHHFNQQRRLFGQIGDDVVLVDDVDVVVGDHIAAGHRSRLALFDAHHLGAVGLVLDNQRLNVQHDIGHVFHDAGYRREFVLRALHLDLCHGATFQAGKQDTPQTVADRDAETSLERLGREFAVSTAERASLTVNRAG